MRNNRGQFMKGHAGYSGMLGRHQSDEAKQKISATHIGHIPWNKGTVGLTKAWNKGLKGIGIGEKNGMWKGDKAGYVAIHIWLRVNFGKANHCDINPDHKARRFEWANISGLYLRNIVDWRQLCPSCHRKDGIRKSERFFIL